MFKQLWLLTGNEVYQQFTYVNPISQPSSSTPLAAGSLRMPTSRQAFARNHPGATLSEKLQTPPLPVTHVLLGYCWSYSRFTSSPRHQARQNNDTPSFRSYRFANPLPLAAQELHTSLHPVGGGEAADGAEPDGNQVNAMRALRECALPRPVRTRPGKPLPALASLQEIPHF